MTPKKLYISHAAALIAALALGACSAPVKKQDDQAVVGARAAERWDLLIKHEAEKAYDYLTPGYRQTITREKYAAQKNDTAVHWKSAHVSSTTCEADACTVVVMVDIDVKMPGVPKAVPSSAPNEEHWLRIGGTWYYLPETRGHLIPGKPGAEPPAGEPAKS